MQRAVADMVGIDSPFFRMHEGRASASTQIAGQTCLNFSSYDYLGLNGHPEVAVAAKSAIEQYGLSCSASRLVAGERPIHRSLERALADHYGVEDCAVFVSGYATNVGVIGQLVGPKDLLVFDAAIHNSAVVGGLLSGANRRSFAHNDLAGLDRLLSSIRADFERVLIVVEGLYSMDGDYPHLPTLIEIKKRHEAWLMIDEAHALGVLGQRGYGLAEHFGIDGNAVDIWMGTLSKTLSSCGGYIAGSTELVEYLKCMAGVFVYSVGLPPALAAGASKALELMHREPERVRRLRQNCVYFHELATENGLDTGAGMSTAVCPILVTDSLPAVVLSQRLLERGINVLPIIYPAVPAKASRLRFFITAAHTDAQIKIAVEATVDELREISSNPSLLRLPILQS
ncbi:MAG: aminotransferase class I/II-fold pyridoxal phosphate-dependent enzyme [Rhizobiales bacterium]|nr:aminotransferase class I/II-fold pyridoxal phosphate-dependent enzyme [Hyphomicrobiales bacterium]